MKKPCIQIAKLNIQLFSLLESADRLAGNFYPEFSSQYNFVQLFNNFVENVDSPDMNRALVLNSLLKLWIPKSIENKN